MIGRVAAARRCRRRCSTQIVERTDGVPLFVEELTKAVLESRSAARGGRATRLTGPLPPLAIPTTLQDSLMARLDRLGTGQGGGADRRRHRPRVLLRAARRRVAAAASELREPRWSSWSRPSWSSAAARRRTRPTPSSTRWCRTPPTHPAAQQAPAAARAHRRGAGSTFPGARRDRARVWRATSAKLGFRTARCRIGQRRPTALPGTMPLLKRSKR